MRTILHWSGWCQYSAAFLLGHPNLPPEESENHKYQQWFQPRTSSLCGDLLNFLGEIPTYPLINHVPCSTWTCNIGISWFDCHILEYLPFSDKPKSAATATCGCLSCKEIHTTCCICQKHKSQIEWRFYRKTKTFSVGGAKNVDL